MIYRLQVTAIFTDYYPINYLLEELDRRNKDMVVIKPCDLAQEARSISVDHCNHEAVSPESGIQLYRWNNSPDTSKRKCNFTSHRVLDLHKAVRSLIKGVLERKYYANQYLCGMYSLTQSWDDGRERGYICMSYLDSRSLKPGACRVVLFCGIFSPKAVNSFVSTASCVMSILTNQVKHR